MALIKSALEIALARTESVKGDRESIELFELKRQGKRIASVYLEDPEKSSIETELKRFPKDKQDSIRRGIFEVLISQVSLPAIKEDLVRLGSVGKGLAAVIGEKRFAQTFQQLLQALERYLSDVEQYDKAIRQQYAPKLKQKEEEIARRTGRRMAIDPMQDPEFVAFYNQNMGALRDRYQTAIDQIRSQAQEAFGLKD